MGGDLRVLTFGPPAWIDGTEGKAVMMFGLSNWVFWNSRYQTEPTFFSHASGTGFFEANNGLEHQL